MEGQPAWQGRAPKVWLAKAEEPDTVSTDSQRDLTSGMLKVNSSSIRETGEREDVGREIVEPRKDRAQLSRGNKGTGKHHHLLPPPSQSPKGNQFPSPNLLAPRKHPMLCFCGSIPLVGLPPSWCCRAPPEADHLRQSKLSLPLLPLAPC